MHRRPEGVLFVGSSSIRLWDALETDFGALPVVIKRGFGGSTLSDCVHYLDRLVVRYRPRTVLVYAGDNDLAEGRTAADVLRQFDAFVHGVHKALPATRIAFISIKPSPARASLLPEIRRANALVEQFAAGAFRRRLHRRLYADARCRRAAPGGTVQAGRAAPQCYGLRAMEIGDFALRALSAS